MKILTLSIFVFCLFSCENIDINSEKCIEMASSNSQIDKPEHGFPKRVELQDINTCINTGAQSINTERASLQSNLVSNQVCGLWFVILLFSCMSLQTWLKDS